MKLPESAGERTSVPVGSGDMYVKRSVNVAHPAGIGSVSPVSCAFIVRSGCIGPAQPERSASHTLKRVLYFPKPKKKKTFLDKSFGSSTNLLGKVLRT